MKPNVRWKTFGDRQGDNGTSESEVDSDDEGPHWAPRRGLKPTSDNYYQEHPNFNFKLSEESDTESSDVTAAGQCDVITRSSSLDKKRDFLEKRSGMFGGKRGRGTAGKTLFTDDVNNIVPANQSEEERRQARERIARTVTG